MRFRLPLMALVCLLVALHLHTGDTLVHPLLIGKAVKAKLGGGAALAAVLSPKIDLLSAGLLKSILFKPLALVALVKIKLALLLGKPLLLLALKKLLLKPALGALLLKIPLLLHPGTGFVLKLLALKAALITKGLIGIKAPLALLVLGASALGSGIGLAIALGKLKEEEDYYEDDYESYSLPAYSPPRPIYSPPPPAASSYGQSPAPSYGQSASPSSYGQSAVAGAGAGAGSFASAGGSSFGSSFGSSGGFPSFGSSFGSSYRKKRQADSAEDTEDEEDEDYGDEGEDEIRAEFEAARANGDVYLHLAAQLDEKSCGRRLMCEVYQKSRDDLTEDEVLLQEIFGYPLPELSQEDRGSGRELYYRAAYVGATSAGRGGNVCARHFPTCPYDTQQMIDIFVNDEDEEETNEIEEPIRPAVAQQLVSLVRHRPQVQQYQPLRYVAQNAHPYWTPSS